MNCATAGCVEHAQGKSKYCRPHAREARERWLTMIREKDAARDSRDATFSALWAKAVAAARQAHAEAVPAPMSVFDANLDGSPVEGGNRYYVSEGACGFGTVRVLPATSSFARWAVKCAGFRKSYSGGITVGTNYGSQSIERADAAARAMADVLREAGITAYAESRLD